MSAKAGSGDRAIAFAKERRAPRDTETPRWNVRLLATLRPRASGGVEKDGGEEGGGIKKMG